MNKAKLAFAPQFRRPANTGLVARWAGQLINHHWFIIQLRRCDGSCKQKSEENKIIFITGFNGRADGMLIPTLLQALPLAVMHVDSLINIKQASIWYIAIKIAGTIHNIRL